MRASGKVLEKLHNQIAETLGEEIQKYRDGQYLNKDGDALPVPSALIAATIKYLKDNSIDRPEDEEPDPEDLLSDELPSFDEE